MEAINAKLVPLQERRSTAAAAVATAEAEVQLLRAPALELQAALEAAERALAEAESTVEGVAEKTDAAKAEQQDVSCESKREEDEREGEGVK